MSWRSAAALGAAALLVAPAGAQAVTKTVTGGASPAVGKTLQDKYGSEAHAYFPQKTTIRAGDSVRFVPFGFHNFEFPKKGTKGSSLLTATDKTATDVKDAANAPFWFNGQPLLGFDLSLAQGSFGKTVTVDGSKRVDSGLPLADDVKPMVAKFPKPGTYSFLCAVHAGMKGQITVKGARSSVPSAKADAKRAKSQERKALAAAKKLAKAKAPDKTVELGAQSGGVHRYAFVPEKLSVPVGTTVRFRMPSNASDFHTASFGPGDPSKESGAGTYLGKLAKSFEDDIEAFNPISTHPSEPAGTTATLTPALHGNGFWNTGLLDADGSSPFPREQSVTLGQAGTYSFYCLIHPFMKGSITAS